MVTIDELRERYRGQTVVILGNGVTTIGPEGNYLDFSEQYQHIWTCNGGWLNHPTSSLGFMMDDWASPAHDDDNAPREIKEAKLKTCPIPVLTPTAYPEFKCFVEYPLRDVINFTKRIYFGETISYAVAFAIFCEVKELHLHGTDYHGCKPAERACTEYWCSAAIERGILIGSNPNSHFLNTQLDERNNHIPNFYGYIHESFPFDTKELGDGRCEVSFGVANKGKEKFKTEYQEFVQNRMKHGKKERSRKAPRAKKIAGKERDEIESLIREGTGIDTKAGVS